MQSVYNREWKNNKSMGLHFFYTSIWNIFSWAGILRCNGYHSMSDAIASEPITLVVYLFPLLGLVMMYSCVAHWINRTEFKIEDDHFKTAKGPIPWPGKKLSIPVHEIKQAYVQEYYASSDSDSSIRYRVMVQMRSSIGEVIVDSDICHYPDALALEEWLEKKMGIENQSVPGEVGYKKVS